MDITDNAALATRWRTFYDKLRQDMVEAQCCLESGQVIRASELIDSSMREARRTGAHFGAPDRQNSEAKQAANMNQHRRDPASSGGQRRGQAP